MRFFSTFLSSPRHGRSGSYIPLPTISSSPSPPSSPRIHAREYSRPPDSYKLRRALQLLRPILHHLSPFRLVVAAVLLLTAGHWIHISSTASSPSSGTDSSLFLITDDKHHRVFQDHNPGMSSTDVLPIRAYDAMTDACVEDWIVHHRWTPECQTTDLTPGLQIDGVWAWVNGSDPAQVASRRAFKPGTPLKMDADHRYADHNELLYSMRSFLKSVGPDVLKRMHILASAYPLGDAIVGPGTEMVGQIPGWLSKDASLRRDEGPIILHHDSDYFKPLPIPPNATMTDDEIARWRQAVIPSFNSLAVESQIYNTPATLSDQLVYLNDDFFTLRPNEVADYTSPLFGPVLRSLTTVGSIYLPAEYPFQRLWNPAGEEVGIKRAAWMLGQRFPLRSIPYIQHHPRTLWHPLLREAAQTFPAAFGDTALARFRAQQEVPPSIQPFALASWYVVQRHREALLWTWVVAKHGGLAGEMTPDVKAAMWRDLAGSDSAARDSSLSVRTPARESVAHTGAFERSGVKAPRNTAYSFSSKDGYSLSYLDQLWYWNRPKAGYPDLTKGLVPDGENGFVVQDSKRPKLCTLKRSCLRPGKTEGVDALFKRIAFSDASCGDCAIAALMGAAGTKGIDVFMPAADVVVPADYAEHASAPAAERAVAHLPLTSRWRDTDFALRAVLAGAGFGGRELGLRAWAARLVQRYQYVMGTAPNELFQMKYPDKVRARLAKASAEIAAHAAAQAEWVVDGQANGAPDGGLTFLCLNDDIVEGRREIDGMLREWFEERWPEKMPDEVPHGW